ncbi:MAG: M20/M25/M40 family metallo-hydrolase [Gemmatimonadota bacterium]
MRTHSPAAVLLVLTLGVVSGACSRGGDTSDGSAPVTAETRAQRLERLLTALAHDSMGGREVGTEGAHRAQAFLARELAAYGVEPAGDSGFFQFVPMGHRPGTRRYYLPGPDVDLDTFPEGSVLTREANVVGIIPGSDSGLRDEAVVLGAHFDHVGIRTPVDGDSIYNGADDDGTGTVAVLEIARSLAAHPPSRSVVVLLSTAEEKGLVGTRWYLEHPVVPLEHTVADFQIEMIGRPDSLAGGPGQGWLTGYERTTMGDQLREAGSPIVPDPRPEMRFFFRSDNLPFALKGIPAHTLSSYNLHTDYHRPTDEVDRVDFRHMTAMVDAAEAAVRLVASGPRPGWKEGGRVGLPPEDGR